MAYVIISPSRQTEHNKNISLAQFCISNWQTSSKPCVPIRVSLIIIVLLRSMQQILVLFLANLLSSSPWLWLLASFPQDGFSPTKSGSWASGLRLNFLLGLITNFYFQWIYTQTLWVTAQTSKEFPWLLVPAHRLTTLRPGSSQTVKTN